MLRKCCKEECGNTWHCKTNCVLTDGDVCYCFYCFIEHTNLIESEVRFLRNRDVFRRSSIKEILMMCYPDYKEYIDLALVATQL